MSKRNLEVCTTFFTYVWLFTEKCYKNQTIQLENESSGPISRKIMVLVWCLILWFVSLFVYKAKTLAVKAVKASINVSKVSCKSCILLWYAKKEKYLQKISFFTFTKIFSPGLPNLGTQIRSSQNRYTTVQTDLKYPQLKGY